MVNAHKWRFVAPCCPFLPYAKYDREKPLNGAKSLIPVCIICFQAKAGVSQEKVTDWQAECSTDNFARRRPKICVCIRCPERTAKHAILLKESGRRQLPSPNCTMSYADQVFIRTVTDILQHGVSDEGLEVRPRWEDGSPAHTLSLFGVVNRYDLSREFPILTLRRIYWKSAWDEISWIWQKKSNNIHDLGSHIWDQWADASGCIGKAYGYQMGVKYPFPEGTSDQVDHVIWQLQHEPASRRIITNMYNFSDLHEMALAPCAYSVTFVVKGRKLNAILNQRSQDMITANAWNCCQYSMLLLAMASAYGFEPGELVHVIGDCHIYDRHIPLAKQLIANPCYDAPEMWVDPTVRSFYDFTRDSFRLDGYRFSPFDQKIPVAV